MAIIIQNSNIGLGYKSTEIGVIPKDWELMPLGLLSAFITKGATPTTYGFNWVDNGILFLRSECVSEQGLDLTQSMFITPKAHNLLKRSEVRAGDILITITGNVGRVIYLNNGFEIANINQHIARIKVIDSKVDSNFVFHFLSQFIIRKYYNSITTGQAYPQISLKQVRDTPIPIPPLSEQQAIATTLSDVDAIITSLDKLITKKRDIKQATMQQLLTGKTRLPGFSGEWEVKKLGEITQSTAGGTPSTLVEEYWGGNIKWMSSGELNAKRIYDVGGRITEEGLKNSSTKIIPSRCILVGLAGQGKTRGTVAINMIELCTNQSIAAIFPSNHFVPEYLYFNLDSRYDELRNLSTGEGGRGGLNLSIISSLIVPLPSLPEQQAIAAVLSDMDAEIVALEQKRDKTRVLKQGMMQELLTGKTRLV